MPQVPYQPFPTARPDDSGIRGPQVATTGAQFGENVGRAIEHLGGTLEKSGDELWSRAVAIQETQNRADADSLVAQFGEGAGVKSAEFTTKLGKDARDGLVPHIDDLKALRDQFAGQATNPQIKRFFDSESRGILNRYTTHAAFHAGQQGKVYLEQSAEAASSTAQDYLFHHPDDPDAMQAAIEATRNSSATKAAVRGLDGPAADLVGKKGVSTLISHYLSGLAEREPFKAMEMFKENQDKLFKEDFDRVYNTLRQKGITVASGVLADRYAEPFKTAIEAGESPPSVTKATADIRREAKSKFPELGDDFGEILADHAEKAFLSRLSQVRSTVNYDIRSNNSTLAGALQRGGGNIFDVRALTASDPKAQAAYDALPPEEQNKWPGRIYGYIRAAGRQHNDEQMLKFLGIKHDDPMGFLDIDPTLEEYKLSPQNIEKIWDLQTAVRKSPQQNEPIARALSDIQNISGPTLRDMGLMKGTPQFNKDDYNLYVGYVTAAMENWNHNNPGKRINDQQIREEIAPEVTKKMVTRTWWDNLLGSVWNTSGTETPAFKEDVPKWFSDQKTKEVQDLGGTTPTVDQIRFAYYKYKLQQVGMKRLKEGK